MRTLVKIFSITAIAVLLVFGFAACGNPSGGGGGGGDDSSSLMGNWKGTAGDNTFIMSVSNVTWVARTSDFSVLETGRYYLTDNTTAIITNSNNEEVGIAYLSNNNNTATVHITEADGAILYGTVIALTRVAGGTNGVGWPPEAVRDLYELGNLYGPSGAWGIEWYMYAGCLEIELNATQNAIDVLKEYFDDNIWTIEDYGENEYGSWGKVVKGGYTIDFSFEREVAYSLGYLHVCVGPMPTSSTGWPPPNIRNLYGFTMDTQPPDADYSLWAIDHGYLSIDLGGPGTIGPYIMDRLSDNGWTIAKQESKPDYNYFGYAKGNGYIDLDIWLDDGYYYYHIRVHP